MSSQDGIEPGRTLKDASGEQASVVAVDHAGTEDLAVVRLQDGRQLAFPFAMLSNEAGTLRFDGNFADLSLPVEGELALPDAASRTGTSGQAIGVSGADEIRIPVIEERLRASKRVVHTGRGVRIYKTVEQTEQTVDLPLMNEEIEVERIACDVLLPEGEVASSRQEGDTLILPVVEEVIVVQKRLRVREEIHVRRKKKEVHHPQQVVLRSEKIHVERFDESAK